MDPLLVSSIYFPAISTAMAMEFSLASSESAREVITTGAFAPTNIPATFDPA
jgi:hypothetical protein